MVGACNSSGCCATQLARSSLPVGCSTALPLHRLLYSIADPDYRHQLVCGAMHSGCLFRIASGQHDFHSDVDAVADTLRDHAEVLEDVQASRYALQVCLRDVRMELDLHPRYSEAAVFVATSDAVDLYA